MDNPFAVLDLSLDADMTAARSRYRKLARENHPDSTSNADKLTATRIMARLNWAMEELDRDFEGWRSRCGTPSPFTAGWELRTELLSVQPHFVVLHRGNSFQAYLTASVSLDDSDQIEVRYVSSLIVVERLPLSPHGVANFCVSLAAGIELDYPLNERLHIHAPGAAPIEVTVAIEPLAGEDAPSDPAPTYADTRQPIFSRRLEIIGWLAALILGSATVALYLV
jgi:hypothetical protein